MRHSLLELRAMWLLESTPESPETLLFRLIPGSIKTVGRAPRAPVTAGSMHSHSNPRGSNGRGR